MTLLLKKVFQSKNRKKYKKSLFLIPYFFTFGNALFGFASLIYALQGNNTVAAACLGLAAVMDACDGKLARLFGSTSYLGAELDSLCDAISFCLAPTILIYCFLEHVMFPLLIIVLGFYLCAGLFRLARFNIIASQSTYFVGLPTTVSAFFLASLLYYHDWLEQHCALLSKPSVILCCVAFLALLMVSTIPFSSIKSFRIPFPYSYLCTVLALCALLLCYLYKYPLFLIGLAVYIILHCLRWVMLYAKYLINVIKYT